MTITPVHTSHDVRGREPAHLMLTHDVGNCLTVGGSDVIHGTRLDQGIPCLWVEPSHVNSAIAVLVLDYLWPDGFIKGHEHFKTFLGTFSKHLVDFLGALHGHATTGRIEQELLTKPLGFNSLTFWR